MQETVAAGDQWSEGWVRGALYVKDAGRASEEAVFTLWAPVPALSQHPYTWAGGGQGAERCPLKSPVLA